MTNSDAGLTVGKKTSPALVSPHPETGGPLPPRNPRQEAVYTWLVLTPETERAPGLPLSVHGVRSLTHGLVSTGLISSFSLPLLPALPPPLPWAPAGLPPSCSSGFILPRAPPYILLMVENSLASLCSDSRESVTWTGLSPDRRGTYGISGGKSWRDLTLLLHPVPRLAAGFSVPGLQRENLGFMGVCWEPDASCGPAKTPAQSSPYGKCFQYGTVAQEGKEGKQCSGTMPENPRLFSLYVLTVLFPVAA